MLEICNNMLQYWTLAGFDAGLLILLTLFCSVWSCVCLRSHTLFLQRHMTHSQTRSWADKGAKAIKTLWLLHRLKIKQMLSFEQVRRWPWDRIWHTQKLACGFCEKLAGRWSTGSVNIQDFLYVSLLHRAPVLPAERVLMSDSAVFRSEFLRSEGNIPSVSTYTHCLH